MKTGERRARELARSDAWLPLSDCETRPLLYSRLSYSQTSEQSHTLIPRGSPYWPHVEGMATSEVPSDLLPHVYSYLVENNLLKAAASLKKECGTVSGERPARSAEGAQL